MYLNVVEGHGSPKSEGPVSNCLEPKYKQTMSHHILVYLKNDKY